MIEKVSAILRGEKEKKTEGLGKESKKNGYEMRVLEHPLGAQEIL